MVLNSAYSKPPSRNSSSHVTPYHSASGSRESSTTESSGLPASSAHDHDTPPTQQGSEDSTASTVAKATAASARERIVNSYNRLCGHSSCNENGTGGCEHGLLSPQASSTRGDYWGGPMERGSGSYGGKFDSRGGDVMHGVFGDAVTEGLIRAKRGQGRENDEQGIKVTSTTGWLAKRHHVKGRRLM